ncbi:CubicO group peptidase, beta-lactamase class C family [Lutibacter oricola]|uniref:CubicO group peptidase, beta-lactamase class C family n=1 Tax=Lutibacter oricola TaxID=762486 RepID=A0A1H3ANL2_9FLAO|nr:serine hydrolase [Lutibacter oricola]SDX30744.1 CubicO group peptidase, beta-lactamase class C family [Lutibacter oricola]
MKFFKLTLLLLLISFSSNSQTKEQLNHLDAYFEKSLEEWQLPGMAIAIVNADSIVFSKGYGFANIAKKQKVDGNTLFAVASNSKAFTATAIANLVEEGKLKWTDKVVKYLPYYKMYNDYVTQNTTIEDLLCHRNGLATFSGDLLWYGTTKTPEEIIAAQEYLKPTSEFRTTYGYSNISFLAAGQIIEKVSGKSWATYVSEHFLTPLKMNRTLTSTSQLKNTTNIATPYFFENGKNNELKWVNWDNIAPAGALISSVNDFAKWLQLNINEGSLNDEKLFSEQSFQKITTPHINFSVRKNNEKTNFKSYGLGWSLNDYQGSKIVSHGGGYDGMISKSLFIPEKKLGVVILTNNINWVASALSNKILDVLLTNKLNGKDWSSNYLGYKKQQDKASNTKAKNNESKRGNINKNHLNLETYTGVYKDKMYGTVTVTLKNNKLNFTMDKTPIFYGELKHWNDHIFTFRFNTKLASLPEGKLWFDVTKNGKIAKLHIDVPNPDFDFTEFDFIKQ